MTQGTQTNILVPHFPIWPTFKCPNAHIGPHWSTFLIHRVSLCAWRILFSKIMTQGTHTNVLLPHLPILRALKCLNAHIWPHWATFLIPRAGPMHLEQFFVKNCDSGYLHKRFGTSFDHITNIKLYKCTYRATLGHFSDTLGWPYVPGTIFCGKLWLRAPRRMFWCLIFSNYQPRSAKMQA